MYVHIYIYIYIYIRSLPHVAACDVPARHMRVRGDACVQMCMQAPMSTCMHKYSWIITISNSFQTTLAPNPKLFDTCCSVCNETIRHTCLNVHCECSQVPVPVVWWLFIHIAHRMPVCLTDRHEYKPLETAVLVHLTGIPYVWIRLMILKPCQQICFASPDSKLNLEKRPRPWELWTFEGHLEVETSHDSGARSLHFEIFRFGSMRTYSIPH